MEECVICLETLNASDRANTICGHAFHTSCILENLGKGDNGHMCPMCRNELCSEPFKELKDDNIHQGDYIESLETELDDHKDWVLYFHDQADYNLQCNLKLKEDAAQLRKKTSKLEKNLKSTQLMLTRTLHKLIPLSSYKKRHVKCSQCNCLGHNKKTCQVNPKEVTYISPIITAREFRDKEELFDDLREGALHKLVATHFAM